VNVRSMAVGSKGGISGGHLHASLPPLRMHYAKSDQKLAVGFGSDVSPGRDKSSIGERHSTAQLMQLNRACDRLKWP